MNHLSREEEGHEEVRAECSQDGEHLPHNLPPSLEHRHCPEHNLFRDDYSFLVCAYLVNEEWLLRAMGRWMANGFTGAETPGNFDR